MHDPEVMLFDLRWLEVWHREPGGQDSGAVCPPGRWKWHLHHWRLNSIPLKMLRRRLLTRCAWCGGRSRKGDAVNFAHGWRTDRAPWWRGETHLFHMDCSSVEAAHRMCLCDRPEVGPAGHGTCSACGRHYSTWRVPTDLDRAMAALPKGSRRPQWITDEMKRRVAAATRSV